MLGQVLEEYADVTDVLEVELLELTVAVLVFGVTVASLVPDPELPPPQAARIAMPNMLAEKTAE